MKNIFIIGQRTRRRRLSTYSYSSSPLKQSHHPPPPPPPSSNSNIRSSNTIFPIHILGSGSIGLLYASAIHDKYHQRLRNDAGEEAKNTAAATTCQEKKASDEEEEEEDATTRQYPVTLLMRSHHKSRLIRLPSSSASRHDETLIPPQWVAPVKIRSAHKNKEENNNNIIHQCNIPVEIISDDDCRASSSHSSSHDEDDNNNARVNNDNNNNPIHCLVLATKANDAVSALESIWDTRLRSSQSSSSSSSPTKIIILSNGALAIRDAIYTRFGRRCYHDPSSPRRHEHTTDILLEENNVELILGTTTHGAHQTTTTPLRHDDDDNSGRCNNVGHNYYDITHAGIGCTTCTDLPFTQLCHSIGVGWKGECLSMLDMHVMLWKKLAVNCVINPLTAIYNVTNGQLLLLLLLVVVVRQRKEDSTKVLIMRQILQEVSLVAMMEMKSLYAKILTSSNENGGHGNKNNNTLYYNDQWLLSATEALSSSALEKFVFQVMNSTKDNVSSMLQDMRSGKTTEIEFLNGYVASLGKEKYGLDCPRNLEMCRLVQRKLEER